MSMLITYNGRYPINLIFAHLPVAEVAPLYPPITPKETA